MRTQSICRIATPFIAALALGLAPVASAQENPPSIVQVVALDDIPLFAKYSIIASMQTTHATSDMRWAEERVGPERIRGAYAWRRFLALGVPFANGSDFPVEEPNPL